MFEYSLWYVPVSGTASLWCSSSRTGFRLYIFIYVYTMISHLEINDLYSFYMTKTRNSSRYSDIYWKHWTFTIDDGWCDIFTSHSHEMLTIYCQLGTLNEIYYRRIIIKYIMGVPQDNSTPLWLSHFNRQWQCVCQRLLLIATSSSRLMLLH